MRITFVMPERQGLPVSPFQSSDPRFDYWSAAHRTAYDQLDFALNSDLLLTLFVAPMGAGKTTILREAVFANEPYRLIGMVGADPMLDDDPGRALMEAFGAQADWGDAGANRLLLQQSLEANRASAGLATLVVDDAHLLSDATLSSLFDLAIPSPEDEPVLKLVFTGHPELQGRFETLRPDLLGPVIALEPMSEDDTAGYVRRRLHVGGAKDIRFTKGALAEVYAASGGNPLQVNLLCMFCVDEAVEFGMTRIDAALVDDFTGPVSDLISAERDLAVAQAGGVPGHGLSI